MLSKLPYRDEVAEEFQLDRQEKLEFTRIASHIFFIADSVTRHLDQNGLSITPVDTKREILNWEVKLDFMLAGHNQKLNAAAVAYANRVITHIAPAWNIEGFGTILINPVQSFFDMDIKVN